MVIDTDDTSNFTNNSTTRARLRNVIAHEHGHGLGISHVCPVNRTKLMEPFVSTSFSGVQFDDLITSQGLYGDTMEASGSNTNNNTIANAAQLGTIEANFEVENLSIANTNDVDIYRFNVTSGQRLTLNISPTDESPYPEGPQNGSACTAGTDFNPQNRQNLSVSVIAPNGSTVLATADSTPIGQGENITNLLLPEAGEDYFIEVTGGGENSNDNNNAQVYSLSLNVEPASTLAGSNYQIIEEGCSPPNQRVDPGEIITAQITVSNTGVMPITSPSVSISGSSNFTSVDDSTKSLSNLAVGASTTVDFQFRIDGSCGDQEFIQFTFDTGSGTTTFTQNIPLGIKTNILDIDFASGAPGFSVSSTGTGTGQWNFNTLNGNRAVRSSGSNSTQGATFRLMGPTFEPSGTSNILTFSNDYDLENGVDGGILEIQINGGAWQEWTSAGGTFTENGYSGTIESGSAWTGANNGAVTTVAIFPELPDSSSIRLRWNAIYGGSTPDTISEGWRIDDITVDDLDCCEGNVPMVSISSPDPIAQENDVSNTGEFAITASEAPITNLNIAYTASGSATAGSDYQALAGIATINSGQQLANIPVTAIRDSLAEGNETLTLTLATSPNYAIQTGTASVTIEDLPIDAWRNSFFGTSAVNTGDTDDFDLDGLSNLLEYALGGDPRASNAEQPSASLENGGSQLTLSYEEDTRLTDIEYIVEVSPTLGDGDTPWVTTGVSISAGPTINGRRTMTATTNVNSDRQFMRLRIERN